MKATLLIKNIENIYTCDDLDTVMSRAFIAIHHDKIVDIGTGSYTKWLDEATRVIDAVGECVVPGFIDCDYKGFESVRLGDQLRENRSALFSMRQNGILTLLTENYQLQHKDLSQDILIRKKSTSVSCISRLNEYAQNRPEKFLLSCGFGMPNSYVYSMAPLCYYLYNLYQVDSISLLKAMTSSVAKEFSLTDRGSLEVGKLADLIVLQVPTLDHYFQTLGRSLIHRMIKNGIPFYPEWMVC